MKSMRRMITGCQLLLVTLIVVACSEERMPLDVRDGADPSALFFSQGGQGKRLLPLAFNNGQSAASTSAECTPEAGCTISAHHVTLDVPPGALAEAVEITVYVPSGRFVQGWFEPSGLQFEENVTISMDFGNALPDQASAIAHQIVTNKLLQGMQGVYFTGTLGVDATALDIFELVVNGSVASFETDHFSRYALATN